MKTKKGLALIIVFAVVLLQVFSISVSANLGLVYEAPQGTPVIDGEIDALWDNAPWVNWTYIVDGNTLDDASGRFKAMWDTENIYVFVEVTGPEEVDPEWAAVEIYLAEQKIFAPAPYAASSRQTPFRIADGQPFEYGVPDENDVDQARANLATSGFKKTAAGYNIEVKMALETIKAEVGGEIGFEMQLSFLNDDGVIHYRWNVDTNAGEPLPWSDTTNFGILRFVAAPAAEVAETVDSKELVRETIEKLAKDIESKHPK